MEQLSNTKSLVLQAELRIDKIKILENPTGKTLAFADIQIGPVFVHSFAVMRNDKGQLWVAAPAKLNKEKNSNFAYATINPPWRERIYKSIIHAYQTQRNRAAARAPAPEPPEPSDPDFSGDEIPF